MGFVCRNLVSGEELLYNADEPMVAASVIKLFVLAEAFRQMEAGILDRNAFVTVRKEKCCPSCGALTYMHEGLTVTVEDLYTLMIILSDNTATNYMIDLCGMERINQGIRALGFTKTALNRKLFDSEKAAKGIENIITAGEVAEFLARLAQGKLISPAADAEMVRILKNQRLNGKIPFFIHALPDHADIAHKTGEDDGITHDAGIIFTKEPFVLVFCGNETDVGAYERLMADISLELYRENE